MYKVISSHPRAHGCRANTRDEAESIAYEHARRTGQTCVVLNPGGIIASMFDALGEVPRVVCNGVEMRPSLTRCIGSAANADRETLLRDLGLTRADGYAFEDMAFVRWTESWSLFAAWSRKIS